MKKTKAIFCVSVVLCFVTGFTLGQVRDQGIGLRLGDPVGITYKSYFANPMALEIVVGTSSANWHNNYYRKAFNSASRFDGFDYIDHQVNYTISLQGRLLWHQAVPANVEGRLDWFYGFGVHIRSSDVEYSYFEQDIRRFDKKQNFDLGPEGVVGVEYELLDFPIVAFAEANLMAELIDNPFRFRLFGALGVRYAF